MQNIKKALEEHYTEALNYFTEEQIVGIFLQGSQNYNLATETSDVDTKLIVVPSFKEICLNAKPISKTYIRENNEHIDFKDVRLYMETFRKQNLNFLEILFTDYYIINPLYQEQWNRLVTAREQIARMNPVRAVKSMKGVAMEKYHAMEHRYPSKIDIIDKYGYDGKQVSHLIRVHDFLCGYIKGDSYKDCMVPSEDVYDLILDYKQHKIPLKEARIDADFYITLITSLADTFCDQFEEKEDQAMRDLLEDVSYNIMKISVKNELDFGGRDD